MSLNTTILNLRLRLKYLYPLCFNWLKYLDVSDSRETIAKIINTKCSVSRFGDGEFNLIQGKGNGFQPYDAKLAARLAEILNSESNNNHIVCIPYALFNTDKLKKYPADFWKFYAVRHFGFLKKYLSYGHRYYDSLMTRFYMDYDDITESKLLIKQLKRIWKGRNIIIVEGDATRSGIENDLYKESLSIQRIICPSTNAFQFYSEIINAVTINAKKSDLILLSLGMTATVLAFDLSKLGFQAIDLGHLDVEYEWYNRHSTDKIALPGKYVNEVKNGNQISSCDDPSYHSQIICFIKG